MIDDINMAQHGTKSPCNCANQDSYELGVDMGSTSAQISALNHICGGYH